MQFYSLPSLQFLSFSVFFSTHMYFQNYPLWSTIAQRQPLKDLKLLQLTWLLVASKHCLKMYVLLPSVIHKMLLVILNSLFYKNQCLPAGWGRFKTPGTAEQQKVTNSEHWLCARHVTDICADIVHFSGILVWRYWKSQFRYLVSFCLQLCYSL